MSVNTYEVDTSKPIKRIDFTLLGNDEVKAMSAIDEKRDPFGIDHADLYDNMEPRRGGLIDPRMGVINKYQECATCGLDDCVGHFGHIELAESAFHIGFLPWVKKILSCICLKCSKLLVNKNEDDMMEMLKNKSGKQRLAIVRNLVKNVSYCSKPGYGCGTPVAKIKEEKKKSTGAISLIAELTFKGSKGSEGGDKKIKQILTPEDCYIKLKNISDVDCMILGIDPKKSRPEDMIYKIFPVPPVQVRPSAKVDFMSSSTREDDLTHKLADIIKANIRIRKFKETLTEATSKYAQDHIYLLQYHVATYFDNESVSLPRSEQRGKATKAISSRLKGKEGRIRGNLMGKRVDFSGRTVITPDPTIDINQLGVPIKVAMTLTFPEVVTPQNIDYLQQLVRNGRNKYPGANFVFPVSSFAKGKRILPIDLRYRKDKVELRFGDVVERHIVDDDFVLLNRQPTLHKLSMMGHRIKVIHNYKLQTFRLNVAVTTPYNADFDGDMFILSPKANCYYGH